MLDTLNSPAQAMLYAPIICSVGYDYHISYKGGRGGGGYFNMRSLSPANITCTLSLNSNKLRLIYMISLI